MRKALLFSLLLLALSTAADARPRRKAPAGPKTPVVVELYTAQGCGNCEEANAYVAKLADREGVLALTFSVDYWDYLGWPDSFAKPEFAARQKAYDSKLAVRDPYTPQVVVDGGAEAPGGKPARVDKLVKDAAKVAKSPPDIHFVGSRVYVGSARPPKGGGEVWLVRYDPKTFEVAVKAGDNKGQTIVEKNVVRELSRLGAWKGKPVAFRLPAADEDSLKTLVIVQGAKGGKVVGAAGPKA